MGEFLINMLDTKELLPTVQWTGSIVYRGNRYSNYFKITKTLIHSTTKVAMCFRVIVLVIECPILSCLAPILCIYLL